MTVAGIPVEIVEMALSRNREDGSDGRISAVSVLLFLVSSSYFSALRFLFGGC